MNYHEVYSTLSDDQCNKLGAMIDMALMTKLTDDATVERIVQDAYKSCPDLSKEQRRLFHDISEYIVWGRDQIRHVIYKALLEEFFVKNRDRTRQVVYEIVKKEFIESMDRLTAEQRQKGVMGELDYYGGS